MNKPDSRIIPAKGKLGVLLPGMGAVTSTFIAGVELCKKGLGKPIGSLTQMQGIRLGKRYAQDTPLDWGVAVDRPAADRTRHAPAGPTLSRKER